MNNVLISKIKRGKYLIQWKVGGVCFGSWGDYGSWRKDLNVAALLVSTAWSWVECIYCLITGRVPLPDLWVSAWSADLFWLMACRWGWPYKASCVPPALLAPQVSAWEEFSLGVAPSAWTPNETMRHEQSWVSPDWTAWLSFDSFHPSADPMK